ncbi:Hypothetical protein NocV09_00300210, partial [Nannochloropsis oceanica]
GGGLWRFLQYSGDMQPAHTSSSKLHQQEHQEQQRQQQQQEVQQEAQQEQQQEEGEEEQQEEDEDRPSLFLGGPPSGYLKGFMTGVGGFIVRGVEAAMTEDEGGREGRRKSELGLGELLRRRDAAERE